MEAVLVEMRKYICPAVKTVDLNEFFKKLSWGYHNQLASKPRSWCHDFSGSIPINLHRFLYFIDSSTKDMQKVLKNCSENQHYLAFSTKSGNPVSSSSQQSLHPSTTWWKLHSTNCSTITIIHHLGAGTIGQ
jgi:hypothetical protein